MNHKILSQVSGKEKGYAWTSHLTSSVTGFGTLSCALPSSSKAWNCETANDIFFLHNGIPWNGAFSCWSFDWRVSHMCVCECVWWGRMTDHARGHPFNIFQFLYHRLPSVFNVGCKFNWMVNDSLYCYLLPLSLTSFSVATQNMVRGWAINAHLRGDQIKFLRATAQWFLSYQVDEFTWDPTFLGEKILDCGARGLHPDLT